MEAKGPPAFHADRRLIPPIVYERYEEWTRNLDDSEKRIEVFRRIRDIPYVIHPEMMVYPDALAAVLTRNQGGCTPKHFLLGTMFTLLSISVRYASFTFRWRDLKVQYPASVRKLAEEMPVTLHLACRAWLKGRWALIDATWDAPLAQAGFPVNGEWNGRSQTMNAVPARKEILSDNPEQRMKLAEDLTLSYTERERQVVGEFYAALNAWLTELRRR